VPGQRKYAFIAVVTLSICVLALYIHRHREGKTGRIDNLLISSAGAMQRPFFFLSHRLRSGIEHYFLLVNTKRRNEELEVEVGSLRNKMTALQDLELENQRLREALDFKKKTDFKLMAAHVIAHDVSNDYFEIRLDRGAEEGVRKGMGVISSGGVVGRVLHVTPHYSDVLTLVDPTSNIDALVQRSRARGIISGQSKHLTCKMKYVDRLDDVAVSDTVLSSGFDDIFPKGLVMGYVTSVTPSANGILQSVTVKSAVDVFRLEEVFIVFPPGQPEKAS
jgi:rod shape-determining protein MreC